MDNHYEPRHASYAQHAQRDGLERLWMRDEAERCAKLLARVVSEAFGAEITPEQVKKLIDRKWQTLSDLAHAIHRAR